MRYTTTDLQARVNALNAAPILVVDGAKGPATRKAVKDLMKIKNVSTESGLFHPTGLHRIHWHWTASSYNVTSEVVSHYNGVFDEEGNFFPGQGPERQARYDWRKKIGVSHTLNANTGAIGLSVAAMAYAEGWPKLKWGDYPLTWEGIDGMLKKTAEYCKKYNIPVTKWSTLSHAEIQPTLGIKQRNKWDFMVLPDMDHTIDAVECGDILRSRMKEKYM